MCSPPLIDKNDSLASTTKLVQLPRHCILWPIGISIKHYEWIFASGSASLFATLLVYRPAIGFDRFALSHLYPARFKIESAFLVDTY